MVWAAPERLWLTEDRERVVKDGDPAARFLFAGGPGDEIPRAEAIRLGLLARPAPAYPAPGHVLIERSQDEAEPEQPPPPPVEDKAVRGPLQPPRRGPGTKGPQ